MTRSAERWWKTSGSARYARDQEIIAGQQPAMAFVEKDGVLTLEGDYVVRDTHRAPERLPVIIEFPPDYPRSAPRPLLDGDRFIRDMDHHFYPGRPSMMCLWLPTASLWDPKDADGLQAFLDQVTLFLDRQLIMEADPSLPYPGPEWPHGPAAYVLFLEERLGLAPDVVARLAPGLVGRLNPKSRCPCGSGTQYRRCHQPDLDRFRFALHPGYWQPLAAILAARGSGGAISPG